MTDGDGQHRPGDAGAWKPGSGDPGTGKPGSGDPETWKPGSGDPGTDFLSWLAACHDAVSKLNVNLEAVTVCLKNVQTDLADLIYLMDGRPSTLFSGNSNPGTQGT